VQADAVKLATAGVPKRVIADMLGVARSTFNLWLKFGSKDYEPNDGEKLPANIDAYREFSDAFVQARAKAIVLCEATWLKAVRDGDAAQAAHWLKVHEPELYKDRSDVTIDGPMVKAIQDWATSIEAMIEKAEADRRNGDA